VVKVGGRVAISDIVSDEAVPETLKNDPELWSGCISGAFREDHFLQAFAEAGFHGVTMVKRDAKPWQTVSGIEFRSVTVIAYKGKQGPCLEGNHAIIYPGPWSEVRDDDGHTFKRGERTAVCIKTYGVLTRAPYKEQVVGLPPHRAIPPGEQIPFISLGNQLRPAAETKNAQVPDHINVEQSCCPPGGSCC
jgi:hypothetical protein